MRLILALIISSVIFSPGSPAHAQSDPELFFLEDPAALVANAENLLLVMPELKVLPPENMIQSLKKGISNRDSEAIQKALDPRVLLVVTVNPEGRAKVGLAKAKLPLIVNAPGYAFIKVVNQSGGQQRIRARGTYVGSSKSPFAIEVVDHPKLKPDLSGGLVEYRLLRVTCHETGRRELTIGFDAGQGTQDLGFRGEAPVLFDVRPEP